MNKIWKWWTIVNLVGWSVGLSQYYFDILGFVLANDKTYISVLIAFILVLASARIGYDLTVTKGGKTKNDVYWFLSDAVLSLGMVGTLFGFLLVLGKSFAEIDPSDISSMTEAISTLAVGMSTALLTSLIGLISSLLLKFQLVISEE